MYITSISLPQEFAVHRILLATGVDHLLKDHLIGIAIAPDNFNERPHSLFFWWQADDASTGVSIWDVGGGAAFNFAVIGKPLIDNELFAFGFEAAPNGKTAILSSQDAQGVSLQLATGDGQLAQLIAQGIDLSNNYGLKWSPDGAYFIYNYAATNHQWIARVVRADGTEVRKFRGPYDIDAGFTHCD